MRSGTSDLRAALLAFALAAAAQAETPEELLRQADVSLLAPASFRAELSVKTEKETLPLEVWRAGDDRVLVRFLAAKDAGKFLLRRPEGLFFVAPRAKQPVRLNASYRLSGAATLDEILGTRYSRDYGVERATEEGGPAGELVVLELKARGPAAYPSVRYVVLRGSRRPLRIELRVASGKLARTVEFLAWRETASGPRPARLAVQDGLRPKASALVEVVRLEERAVPEGLLSLTDDAERKKLTRPAER
jgi:hypothetical protein